MSEFRPLAPFSFDGHGINGADGQRLATMPRPVPYDKTAIEYDNTGRLLAAAPALLDALRGIIHEQPYGCTQHAFTTLDLCPECRAWETARQAIKQAEPKEMQK